MPRHDSEVQQVADQILFRSNDLSDRHVETQAIDRHAVVVAQFLLSTAATTTALPAIASRSTARAFSIFHPRFPTQRYRRGCMRFDSKIRKQRTTVEYLNGNGAFAMIEWFHSIWRIDAAAEIVEPWG